MPLTSFSTRKRRTSSRSEGGPPVRSAPLRQEADVPPPPNHVAIIMDGNRRWARARGMPPAYGHRRGAEAVRKAVEACAKEGIRYLTLYAFSSEKSGHRNGRNTSSV